MNNLFWMGFCFLAFAPGGFSQSPEKPADITVRIQTVSLEDHEIEGLYWMQEGEGVLLRVPVEFLSMEKSYTGPNPITFFRKAPPVEGEEQARFVPVAQVLIPEDTAQAVLLFQERLPKITGTAIPLRPQVFPEGSYMMFNQTGRDVLMVLDEKPHHLANRSVQVIQPENREKRAIPIILRFQEDPDAKSLISTTWFYHPERRRFVFLRREDERIQVKGVTWFPPDRK